MRLKSFPDGNDVKLNFENTASVYHFSVVECAIAFVFRLRVYKALVHFTDSTFGLQTYVNIFLFLK